MSPSGGNRHLFLSSQVKSHNQEEGPPSMEIEPSLQLGAQRNRRKGERQPVPTFLLTASHLSYSAIPPHQGGLKPLQPSGVYIRDVVTVMVKQLIHVLPSTSQQVNSGNTDTPRVVLRIKCAPVCGRHGIGRPQSLAACSDVAW